MSQALVVVSHGTVDDLEDLAAFVTNVRRGHPPPPELLTELRRRYDRIGGSPLNRITVELALKLESRFGLPVRAASRLWKPYVRDVLIDLAGAGVRDVALVPLAQHSAPVYAAAARSAATEAGVELAAAPNWGQNGKLREAFVRRIVRALEADADREATTILMTAHSLPRSVIDAGDPYEREVRASASAIARRVTEASGRVDLRFEVAFQSQGFAGPGASAWLGPDIATTLDATRAVGVRRVLFAPIGFLADHVEILYDLDIEARDLAAARGLSYARTTSLNADDDLVDALVDVATPLLASTPAR
jgi:ferrochelatase